MLTTALQNNEHTQAAKYWETTSSDNIFGTMRFFWRSTHHPALQNIAIIADKNISNKKETNSNDHTGVRHGMGQLINSF